MCDTPWASPGDNNHKRPQRWQRRRGLWRNFTQHTWTFAALPAQHVDHIVNSLLFLRWWHCLCSEQNRNLSKSNTWIKKCVYRYYWGYWHIFWTWALWGNHHLHLQFFNRNFFFLYNMLDLCFLSSLISLKPYPILINWTWFTKQCYYNMLKCNTIHCPYFINRGPWARSLF